MPEDVRSPSTASAARLRLLGETALERPGQPAWRFLPERRFRLLAYVAWRGDWVSRDQLAALFWPERTQEAARSNLRKLLLEARSLELADLQSDRAGVRWVVDTDVAALRAAQAHGDHEAAVALYGGDLMRGIEAADAPAFSEWLERERLSLRALWRSSALAALAQRTPAARVALARRLLDDDPLDEDAVVVLLEAQHALGEEAAQADSLRTYATRLIEDLGIEPSARVRAAAAGTGRAAGPERRAAAAAPAAAPVAADGFVGRGRELDELCALLANHDCRLLTVTGPGGVGKSRLAKEALRRLAPAYPDGTRWIALDDLTEVAEVGARIAAELRLDVAARQDPVDIVARHLSERRMLLVLDNSEHLPQLAALVVRLLANAPGLQLVSTSRARMGIAHEWLLPLNGLTLPPADAQIADIVSADAVKLFAAQARTVDPRFNVGANAVHIATLVRAVGGMPLAVLLAASWIRLVPMLELAQEVTKSLDVLERAEDGDERPEHRSIRATLEQSWRLLAPAEQRALAALSVMAGSFTRSAAREVAEAPLPLLAALVDKSLLQVDADGRFSLHPLTLQFAAERLAAMGPAHAAARRRHALFFARLMVPWRDFDAVDSAKALASIAPEIGNVQIAWDTAIEFKETSWLADLAAALGNHYQAHGGLARALPRFQRAEELLVSYSLKAPEALCRVALEHAALNFWLADYAAVERSSRHALSAARTMRMPRPERQALNALALAAMRQGQAEKGAALLERVLASARREGSERDVAVFAGNLSGLLRELGESERAEALALEALQGHRRHGHAVGEVSVLNELALIAHQCGHLESAFSRCTQTLEVIERNAEMALRKPVMLTLQASIRLDQERADEALVLAQASWAEVTRVGARSHAPTLYRVLAEVDLALGRLGEAAHYLRTALALLEPLDASSATRGLLCSCASYACATGRLEHAALLSLCAEVRRPARGTVLPRYQRVHQQALESLSAARVAALKASATKADAATLSQYVTELLAET
ncbi:MAG: BTAD domain-containing putative transcriptional regulator [Burkholderiaceae bacterium]|nr:BTAD domain-containing putative transcriptional regulator [Burkholderiaceae bacterium]